MTKLNAPSAGEPEMEYVLTLAIPLPSDPHDSIRPIARTGGSFKKGTAPPATTSGNTHPENVPAGTEIE
jgi:hypothetical protein